MVEEGEDACLEEVAQNPLFEGERAEGSKSDKHLLSGGRSNAGDVDTGLRGGEGGRGVEGRSRVGEGEVHAGSDGDEALARSGESEAELDVGLAGESTGDEIEELEVDDLLEVGMEEGDLLEGLDEGRGERGGEKRFEEAKGEWCDLGAERTNKITNADQSFNATKASGKEGYSKQGRGESRQVRTRKKPCDPECSGRR